MGGGAGAGRAWWGRAPQLVMTKPASASARRLPGGCYTRGGGEEAAPLGAGIYEGNAGLRRALL